MDVHVPAAITEQLRLRGVDVVTAQDDDQIETEDEELLDHAIALGRALFTRDEDFLAITAQRQHHRREFAGVIYAHQLHVSVGRCVVDLELIAKCYLPVDLLNRVEYLPL
ncbi:MAG: DUF5615 family PIN-like protein [Planctomycetaceae bacterium]